MGYFQRHPFESLDGDVILKFQEAIDEDTDMVRGVDIDGDLIGDDKSWMG